MKLAFKKSKNGKAFFINLWRSGLHDYVNPLRDWTVMLAAATLVLVSAITYIAFDFYIQFAAPPKAVEIESQSLGYRDVEVERYADLYTEKERIFNELRKNKVYIPEPVIEEVASSTLTESEAQPLAEIELAE